MKMKPWVLILLLFYCFCLSEKSQAQQNNDFRKIENGHSIYESGYIDQPYVVVLEEGTWLCVFTTSSEREGAKSQHIMAGKSDDQGKTWGEFVKIETPEGPEASWAMPYLTDYGRVYVFYDYNGDTIRTLNDNPIRTDMLGWYCYRYSDDGGKTWSERYRLPVRKTPVDYNNDWNGEVQIMWGIGKPVDVDDGMMFGFTKLGAYPLGQGEGWFFRCDNINTERDPDKLNWEMLPEGNRGVRNPEFGSVQEEHNLFQMNNGGLYTMYRTRTGYAVNSYSRDGGKTWSLPKKAKYANGDPIKNPRACPRIWKCENGKYLFWYHNHSGTWYADRNPAWVAGGIEKDGKILWSQPEVLFYGEDRTYESGRYSYPDLVEDEGKYYITETNKENARVHQIPNAFFEQLWDQFDNASLSQEDLVKQVKSGDEAGNNKIEMMGMYEGEGLISTLSNHGGFALDFTVKLDDRSAGQMLFDARNNKGEGIYLKTTGYNQIELGICNSEDCNSWSSDPGLLDVVQPHHVTAIVDNGPNLIMFVVDGELCDGGKSRQYGWGRFSKNLGHITGAGSAKVNFDIIEKIRMYDRNISVSEAVGNYRYEQANGL